MPDVTNRVQMLPLSFLNLSLFVSCCEKRRKRVPSVRWRGAHHGLCASFLGRRISTFMLDWFNQQDRRVEIIASSRDVLLFGGTLESGFRAQGDKTCWEILMIDGQSTTRSTKSGTNV
jgi:hypothetical protein